MKFYFLKECITNEFDVREVRIAQKFSADKLGVSLKRYVSKFRWTARNLTYLNEIASPVNFAFSKSAYLNSASLNPRRLLNSAP